MGSKWITGLFFTSDVHAVAGCTLVVTGTTGLVFIFGPVEDLPRGSRFLSWEGSGGGVSCLSAECCLGVVLPPNAVSSFGLLEWLFLSIL